MCLHFCSNMAAFVLRRTVADRGTKNVWANNHQGFSEKKFSICVPACNTEKEKFLSKNTFFPKAVS